MNLRNTQTLLFLEDSSQSGYGGGQRITENICLSLNKKLNIKLIDTSKSILANNLIKKMSHFSFYNLNLNAQKKISFNFLLILKSVFLIYKNRKTVDALYLNTRKHLLTGILCKILCKNFTIYSHYHLCTKKTFFWLIYDFFAFFISKKCIFASHFLVDDFLGFRLRYKNFFNFNKILTSPYPPAKWDTSVLNLPIPTNPFVIGYAGKLSEVKGIKIFIESLKRLPKNKNFRVLIAGQGELKQWLEEEIHASRWTGPPIISLGHVQTDFDFYQQLSLVVMPSFWIRETIGLTALEALQAGLPVLVPHTGNLEHFILENLAIPIAPDPDDIAKKIVLCCEELEKNCSRKRNKTQDIKNNFNAFYQKIFCE